jgi:hypothetical protein
MLLTHRPRIIVTYIWCTMKILKDYGVCFFFSLGFPLFWKGAPSLSLENGMTTFNVICT